VWNAQAVSGKISTLSRTTRGALLYHTYFFMFTQKFKNLCEIKLFFQMLRQIDILALTGVDNAQQCAVHSKCDEVAVAGTCMDEPVYNDCDGNSCAYYTEFPEECGKNDHHCGDNEDAENPCHSQGHSAEGCCACQHHTKQGGCGTWETCEQRMQKEAWHDRQGALCEHYIADPSRCDNAEHTDLTFKGHDAKECCPHQTGRACGLSPCPAGEYGDMADAACVKCAAGKFNPGGSASSVSFTSWGAGKADADYK